ncbi:MAG: 1-acyl-sn-glycerol-3-phosphate acyltransferase [Candidatus Scalindua sp.]|nr:1-acyl-sn-glycerol-3-phosphate acyltransferase [Candidatus Scalindua sp.]
MKKTIFNLTFYPLFVIVTIGMSAFFFFPVVIARPFIGVRRTLWVTRQLIRWYGLVVTRFLMFPFVRIIYKDFEKGKEPGVCVYVCNHRSSSDGFLMAYLGVECVQVASNWPFKIPVIGWIARVAGYLNVQKMSSEDFETTACQLLKENVSIVAFPEGSRTTDSKVRQFNGSVFRLAQKAGIPIVPLCISGNQKMPEKDSWVLTPGTIYLHKLPTIHYEEFKDLIPFKLKNMVREIIQNEVDKLEI